MAGVDPDKRLTTLQYSHGRISQAVLSNLSNMIFIQLNRILLTNKTGNNKLPISLIVLIGKPSSVI